MIAFSVAASSGAVLRAAGRIWLGWGDGENPGPDSGTADDPGEEEAAERPGSSGRRGRVPLTIRRAAGLRRALAAGTAWLRHLHSGLVGDQVTWLAAGLALLAALTAAALH